MAAQSCHYMLWQQAVAAKCQRTARKLARQGMAELRRMESAYTKLWPLRSQATPRKSAPFLAWRLAEYRRGTLPVAS